MSKDFGISIWADENFYVDGDNVKVNHLSSPSLLQITKKIRACKHSGPLLLRFPHLIKKQIDLLYNAFDDAKREFGYRGDFHALFPLKVNQYSSFIHSIIDASKNRKYGLEAGSKAELIIAMDKTPPSHPITVNGFKDKEMISLIFIAAMSGHNITVIIEGLPELDIILEVHQELNSQNNNIVFPKIGMRVRLHSTGVGDWVKSGGYDSKFGLSSTELLEARERLSRDGLLEHFVMIHFHIGSQMSEISPIKKALREAGNIYASLKQKGAKNLHAINIGGGLAVEYSQQHDSKKRNYSLREFANDVVFMMQEISKSKGVSEPDIYTESGRFVAASHSVLIAPVLELFTQEYHQGSLRPKEKNPPLIDELYDLLSAMDEGNAREYLHDALDHKESLLTLFDLGYIDLEDRSNAEILVDLIFKKYINLFKDDDSHKHNKTQDKIVEKYLLNFSIFQSLPDFWGIDQKFPVMPISHLSSKPVTPASIWDITCDSDGEIPFSTKDPLYLHDINLDKEEYYLAFFLTGAYQEILGMNHNLFTRPTEAIVTIDSKTYTIDKISKSKSLKETVVDLGYDIFSVEESLREKIKQSIVINDTQKEEILDKLQSYMSENCYLKTIQAIRGN